jgi:hypothetical protein
VPLCQFVLTHVGDSTYLSLLRAGVILPLARNARHPLAREADPTSLDGACDSPILSVGLQGAVDETAECRLRQLLSSVLDKC